MTTIHADQVRPGDLVEYHGECHLVSRVHRNAGFAWPVACDDTGWAIALGSELVVVHRPA